VAERFIESIQEVIRHFEVGERRAAKRAYDKIGRWPELPAVLSDEQMQRLFNEMEIMLSEEGSAMLDDVSVMFDQLVLRQNKRRAKR